MIILAESTNIFIQMVREGGIPGLSILVCFLILMAYLKIRAKSAETAQQEREKVASNQIEQYNHLMDAYEDLVKKFIDLISENIKTIASLRDQISQCPMNGGNKFPVTIDESEDA